MKNPNRGKNSVKVSALLFDFGGTLAFLDGTPVAGAPIAIQARTVSRRGEVVRERTLAQTTTDSAGQWSLPTSTLSEAHGGMWLRALCPGGAGFGAVVSEPLRVEAMSLTSPSATPQTPTPEAPPAT